MNRAGHALQALILGTICATGPAVAAKLDRDTCAALAGELAELAATGIRSEMERGPTWCHANLPLDRLRRVHRLLEIEDQLELRCGRAKRAPASPAPGGVPASPGGPILDARGAVPPPSTGGAPAPATTAPAKSPMPQAGQGTAAATPVAAPPAPAHPVVSTPVAPPAAAAASPVPSGQPAAAMAPPAAAPTPPAQTKPALGAAAAAQPGPTPAPSSPAITQPGTSGAAGPVTTKAIPVVTKQVAGPTAGSPVKTISVSQPSGHQPAAVRDTATAALPPVSAAAPHQGVAPKLAPAGTVAPAAGKSVDPAAQAARKTNPRRKPVSAYVPPDEVSPFSLPGLR